MAKSIDSIVKLEGFDELIQRIEKAGGDADKAARQARDDGAVAMEQALKAECNAANVPSSISSQIRVQSEGGDGRYKAKVGWDVPNYDPTNPAIAFLAMFLNYGTPRRQTKAGKNRGLIVARGFIQKAKRKGGRAVKKAEQDAFKRILKELNGD